ncbi:MAG: DMT family transporter [Planctomycetes bacterium]|nr:DMT family transporter [Planctomycetota bacterium]
MDSDRRLGLMMASTTALLWGVLAVAMKVATNHVPVMTITWFRFAFAFSLLFVFIARRGKRRLKVLVRPPLLGLVAALGLTGNYLGYLNGLHFTTPSNAQILIQTAPLMLALVGIVMFKERLKRSQWLGVGVALVGFVLFAWNQHQEQVISHQDWLRGNGMIFLGAVSWVVYAAIAKLLGMRGLPPQDLNLLIYAVPAAMLWPWVDFALLASLSWKMWILMAFLGANTLVAYGFLGEAFKRLPAYQVSLIITLNPLITLAVMAGLRPWGFAWLPADRVGALGYGAALLVVGGVVQVLRRAGRIPAPPPAPAAEA